MMHLLTGQCNGTTPLVSMVMPVWRPRGDWLADAVRSALDQRGADVELIVVDDGNEDPVAPLLRGFDDARLSVVRVPHGGECAGRNAGIAVARGRYLRFVDADDVLDPHSTARLLELVEGRDDVLAYLATVFCDEYLEPIWTMSARTRGAALVDCLLNQFPVRLPAMLFPRAVIDLTGAWDTSFRVCQDWDFCLRAVEHAEVRAGDGVGVFYRRHGDSATADTTAGSEGRRAVVDRFFERHPEHRGTWLHRRALGMLRARDARIALQRGDLAAAVPLVLDAAIHSPRAVVTEFGQALPAVWARGNRRTAPARPAVAAVA